MEWMLLITMQMYIRYGKKFSELIKEVKHCKQEGNQTSCETFKTIDYQHAVAVLWEAVKEEKENREKLEIKLNSVISEICHYNASYSFCI